MEYMHRKNPSYMHIRNCFIMYEINVKFNILYLFWALILLWKNKYPILSTQFCNNSQFTIFIFFFYFVRNPERLATIQNWEREISVLIDFRNLYSYPQLDLTSEIFKMENALWCKCAELISSRDLLQYEN